MEIDLRYTIVTHAGRAGISPVRSIRSDEVLGSSSDLVVPRLAHKCEPAELHGLCRRSGSNAWSVE